MTLMHVGEALRELLGEDAWNAIERTGLNIEQLDQQVDLRFIDEHDFGVGSGHVCSLTTSGTEGIAVLPQLVRNGLGNVALVLTGEIYSALDQADYQFAAELFDSCDIELGKLAQMINLLAVSDAHSTTGETGENMPEGIAQLMRAIDDVGAKMHIERVRIGGSRQVGTRTQGRRTASRPGRIARENTGTTTKQQQGERQKVTQ